MKHLERTPYAVRGIPSGTVWAWKESFTIGCDAWAALQVLQTRFSPPLCDWHVKTNQICLWTDKYIRLKSKDQYSWLSEEVHGDQKKCMMNQWNIGKWTSLRTVNGRDLNTPTSPVPNARAIRAYMLNACLSASLKGIPACPKWAHLPRSALVGLELWFVCLPYLT